jgi:hypothetical protein
VTTLAIGSLLVLPATALAGNGGHHRVPPGNSGIDQYTESIPGAGGNHPTGGHHGGGGGGGGNGSSVSPGVTSTLNSQGPAGQGAANLATATAPDVGGAGHGGNAQAGQGGKGGGPANAKGGSGTTAGGATSGGSAASGGSGSGVDAIAAELTGAGVDNGMGIFLPIILGAALVGALALVALRLRRGPQQTGS